MARAKSDTHGSALMNDDMYLNLIEFEHWFTGERQCTKSGGAENFHALPHLVLPHLVPSRAVWAGILVLT